MGMAACRRFVPMLQVTGFLTHLAATCTLRRREPEHFVKFSGLQQAKDDFSMEGYIISRRKQDVP
jgi:hypothetical protein